MKKILVLIFVPVLLNSCSNKSMESPQNIPDTLSVKNSNEIMDSSAMDCPRGIPEPVADKNMFPDREFYLNNNIGYETFGFGKDDRVQITNSGCEYYMLSFRIETSRFKRNEDNVKYWSNAAAKLISEIKPGLKANFDWNKALKTLENYKNPASGKVAVKGEELDFGGEDIRSFVTLDNIEKIGNNRYAVEVSFGVGPL